MSVLVDEDGNEISEFNVTENTENLYQEIPHKAMESHFISGMNGQTFRAISGILKNLSFSMRRRTDTKIFANFSIGDVTLGMSEQLRQILGESLRESRFLFNKPGTQSIVGKFTIDNFEKDFDIDIQGCKLIYQYCYQ